MWVFLQCLVCKRIIGITARARDQCVFLKRPERSKQSSVQNLKPRLDIFQRGSINNGPAIPLSKTGKSTH